MAVRLFLDSCALAKRYLAESGSETMQSIMGAPEFRGRLFVSEHVEGEISSLLNKSFRQGRLDRRGLRAARRVFYSHYPSIFAVVPLRDEVTNVALLVLQRFTRSAITYPDALHLAAATYVRKALPAPDLTLVTSDGPLLAVARRLEIPTFNPESDSLSDLRNDG